MYIVTYPSCSEFTKNPEIQFFDSYEKVEKFVLSYRGDVGRLHIYEATELNLKFYLEKKDA